MPNNCINEIIFRNLDAAKRAAIHAALCDGDGEVDFQVLVPLPKNMWRGCVGQKHEKAFKRSALDWATENWGTKWNAYSHRPIETTDDSITFRFETAWRPPYPWLAAVFNTLKLSFEHNWLSEGGGLGSHATFDWQEAERDYGDPWKEENIASDDTPLHRHLHMLLWGVEKFTDEDASLTCHGRPIMYPTLEDHWNWHRAMLIEAREAEDHELAKYHQDALAHLDLERRGLAPRYHQKVSH